jgi:two-component system, OmpR family, response regulator
MQIAILIVDDEEMVRNNLAAYFEDEGMKVAGVDSFEAARDLIEDHEPFDVCIMDMRLPGLDGNTAILALHELYPDLRFLIHTGSARYALPIELRRMGIKDEDVFEKPMADMGPMAEAIRRLAG